MSGNLSIIVNDDHDKHEVVLEGTIDEDADFAVLSGLTLKTIVFNLEAVKNINSCGIREWIKFQNGIGKDVQLVYRKCPQVIVEQMNIVNGFVRKGGQIESFYAPYYDSANDEEIKLLLKPNQVLDGKAPEMRNENGVTLEFDDIEAQYFNFLKNI